MSLERLLRGAILPACLGASILFGACDETYPAALEAPAPVARFESRPSNTTCTAPALATGAIRLEPVYRGLDRPLRMVDRPSLGLVYVGEMPGRIKVIDKASGATTTALDLVGSVGSADDFGLFGFAFHPTKPFVYVVVDRDPDATSLPDLPFRSEVVRFAVSADGKTIDRASEKLVIRIDRKERIHSAGTAEFGPDGLLYIGAGDGGRFVPRWPSDQIVGSVLRLDVDNGDPYSIPPGNPYAKGGGRGEIFAGGFRNPWRFTFDRTTGEMWLGDVGEGKFEEVNRIAVGKNYGWPNYEGSGCRQPKGACDPTGLTPPYFAYEHSEGFSITGGYVYRGAAIPELAGKYVYGDYTVGQIWALEGEGASVHSIILNEGGVKPLISSFGEDAAGELYVMGWDTGVVYRIARGDGSATPAFAPLLSQSGCADPSDAKKPAAGLVPYGVNVELWSDGADKKRWLAIPDGTMLHVADNGHFDLPKGGVAVKEFAIDGKRIETRLLRHHADDTWSGVTYEWRDDQTDAVLLESGKSKALPNGQTWSFPGRVQCFVCHNSAAGMTLGTESLQLNRDFAYAPGQTTNQLTTLADLGYVDKRLEPGPTPKLPALTSSAPVEDRARAYLHTNCSVCHREGGGTGAPMDFRFGLPRAAIKGCLVAGNSGGRGVYLIAPGKPEESVIALRMKSRGEVGYGPMPPLATNRPDDFGASIVEEWIRSLQTCE